MPSLNAAQELTFNPVLLGIGAGATGAAVGAGIGYAMGRRKRKSKSRSPPKAAARRRRRGTSSRRGGRRLKFGSPAWRKKYMKKGRRKKRYGTAKQYRRPGGKSVRYTKGGQPYILTANGKARFIKR